MKATRKLIPAIAMLLISAVMMSTATFAWFSTNTQVSAGGMTIKAKSETLFLQIVAGTDEFDADKDQINADAKQATATIAPVSPASAIAGDLKSLTKLSVASTKDARFLLSTIKWVTAFSDKVSTSTKPADNIYTDVTSNIASLVLLNTFKVRLNPSKGGGVVSAKDLTVSNVSITEAGGTSSKTLLAAARLLVSGPQGVAIYDYDGTLLAGNAIIADELKADGTPVEITVYLYFDGEDSTCFSNNVENAEGYTASFKLDVTGATAGNGN